MARRILQVMILCLILSPAAIWAKKEKTIIYADSILTDQRFHYVMNVSKDWKVRSMTEPSVERAYLEKKNYSIDQKVKSYGGDYTIPTVLVYAQEFNGTAEDFEALLKKSLEEHNSDNEIISRLGLLRDSDFVNSGDVKVGSNEARYLLLKRNYHRVLSSDPYDNNADPTKNPDQYINDHEVHELYVFKQGATLFVIQDYSEREFFQENKVDFDKLIASFKM
jgi:hypothetical protein